MPKSNFAIRKRLIFFNNDFIIGEIIFDYDDNKKIFKIIDYLFTDEIIESKILEKFLTFCKKIFIKNNILISCKNASIFNPENNVQLLFNILAEGDYSIFTNFFTKKNTLIDSASII